MKNKKKYTLNLGANYNSKTDEWNLTLGVNINLEQEDDTKGVLEVPEDEYRLEDISN